MHEYVITEPLNAGGHWKPKRFKEYMGNKLICSGSTNMTIQLTTLSDVGTDWPTRKCNDSYMPSKVHFENNNIPDKICDTEFDMSIWLEWLPSEIQRIWAFCNPEHTNSDVWFIGNLRRQYPYTRDTKIYAPNEPVVISYELVDKDTCWSDQIPIIRSNYLQGTDDLIPCYEGTDSKVSFIMSNPHRRIVFEE